MEFLCRSTHTLTDQLPEEAKQDVLAKEAARAEELAAAGILERTWRVPGAQASWSLWETPDATTLHEVLQSLPLFPWMNIEVYPLAAHYADPGHRQAS